MNQKEKKKDLVTHLVTPKTEGKRLRGCGKEGRGEHIGKMQAMAVSSGGEN